MSQTPNKQSTMTIAVIALLAVIAILLGVIALKDSGSPAAPATNVPQPTIAAQPAPYAAPQAAAPQAAAPQPTNSYAANAPAQAAPAAPPPQAEPQTKNYTMEEAAQFIIKASNAGADEVLSDVLTQIPESRYGELVMTVDSLDAGMGAGFLDWMYRKGHKNRAATAYSNFTLQYQAKLIEVYTRNKMAPIARFLYQSVDTSTQQSIRNQIRQDFPRTYSKIMQSAAG